MTRPVIIEMAGDAAGVPEGWRLVPVEPTPEMIAAAGLDCTTGSLRGAWADMLAAAPALPSEPADDEPPPRRDTLCQELQQQCTDWGTYWRASDAHGVDLSHEQATELLRRALGVEVEIAAPAAAHSTPEAPSIAAAMLDAGEPPDAVILTHADSLADLHGTPRPDNPTPEATAAQRAEAQATGAQADAPQVEALREALQLIAGTDPVDAALDPQRAVRVARAALAGAAPTADRGQG